MGGEKESVKILVTDLDGVLTDGRLTINHDGTKMFKQFHTRDVRAIREFVANGWEVYIVSADGHGSGKAFAEKVGAVFIELRNKEKLSHHIGGRPYICVGDDAWDVPMLKMAHTAFFPDDADHCVKGLCNEIRLNVKGGQGVMAELIFFLLYTETPLEL